MHAGRRASAVLVIGLVAFASRSDADHCCYNICGSFAPPLGLLVTCASERDGCRPSGVNCTVWAEKTKAVECAKPSTCGAGAYDGREAEVLLKRLASDADVVVARPVEFKLSTGERLRFEP